MEREVLMEKGSIKHAILYHIYISESKQPKYTAAAL
jgi:hypothetical protein